MKYALLVPLLLFLILPLVHSDAQVYERAKIASPCDENLDIEVNVVKCIQEVFGAASDVAVAIATAESHLKHEAVGNNVKHGKVWSKDYSIFQVNDYYHKNASQMTAKENIYYAHELFTKYGWTQWATYTSGAYLKYM